MQLVIRYKIMLFQKTYGVKLRIYYIFNIAENIQKITKTYIKINEANIVEIFIIQNVLFYFS